MQSCLPGKSTSPVTQTDSAMWQADTHFSLLQHFEQAICLGRGPPISCSNKDGNWLCAHQQFPAKMRVVLLALQPGAVPALWLPG